MKHFLFFLMFLSLYMGYSQNENQPKVNFYDGIIVGGYVDKGAFLNLMGPSIKMSFNKSTIKIGMLPSIRFKEDKGTQKNALLTPSLGMGISFLHDFWVVQLPLYYNGKNSNSNGKWVLGIGIGVRLDSLQLKEK